MSVRAYLTPTSVEECMGYLTELEGKGMLIAGGTDLMFEIQSGKERPEALIDTQSIEGFDRLDINEEGVVIGAGVTHSEISDNKWLAEHMPTLTLACKSIGSPQIRNVATLAGNVVNAQPAADGAIALVTLGAKAEIISAAGTKKVPVEDLYAGLGQSLIDPSEEILSAFHIPGTRSGQGNTYGRISPRNALCLPIVNAGVWMDTQGGKIKTSRIVLAPVADRPFRPTEAEERLVGADLDDFETFKEAAQAAARASSPRDSCLRGCSDYRKQLIKVLTRRVIEEAAKQAAGSA